MEDARKLTGTGQYDLTCTKSEFDIEEDLNEITVAKENKEELNEVMDNYKRVLSGFQQAPEVPVKREEEKSVPLAVPQPSLQMTQAINKGQMMTNQKMAIMTAMGPDLYHKVYTFLLQQRGTDSNEQVMYEELKRMVGGDKKLMSQIFNLDGIIFMELQAQR